MNTTALQFYTEYYQFYVQDAETKATTDAPDFWDTNESETNRIAYGKGLLGITVATYAEIDVTVTFCDASPTANAEASFIVDAPLQIESGKLQILNCTGFDIQFEKEIANGNYIVRASSFKLETVSNDEGDDYYTLEIWPGEIEKPTIVKALVKK